MDRSGETTERYVTMTVIDTGVGMTDQVMAEKGSEARWKRAEATVPNVGGHAERNVRDRRLISWLDVQGELGLLQFAKGGVAQRVHQSILAKQPPLMWGAPSKQGGLKLDGSLADWKGIATQVMQREEGATGPVSNRCAVAFAVHEDHLWVSWELTDAHIARPASSIRWSTERCDMVSLYLSPGTESGQTPRPGALQFEWVVPRDENANPLAQCSVPGTRVGWRRDGDHVVVELAIPLSGMAHLSGFRGKSWRVESVWQDLDSSGKVQWHSATGRRADEHIPARATLQLEKGAE